MKGYEESLSIGEVRYKFYRMPWGQDGDPKSMRGVLVNICKLMGTSTVGGMNITSEQDMTAFAFTLMSQLGSYEMTQVLEAFGENTIIIDDKGKNRTLTLDFQNLWWSSYPQHLAKWIAESLRVNYADFFDGLKSVGTELRPKQD